jgi:predicted anti-sigma-YlaC factor YlaD
MTCQEYKDLMMAYLDNELDEQQKRVFEQHIASCRDCAREMEEFRRLKKMTDDVAFVEPEDRLWQQYWGGVYNRIERGIGWVIFSLAGILLIIYGGFTAIEKVIEDTSVSVLLKVGLLALLVGLAILFVSVLRERIYFRGKDRYRDVRR